MATSPEPAPAVVTQGDDGRLISLTVGAEIPLRLDSSWAWDQPAVDGDVVTPHPGRLLRRPRFHGVDRDGCATGRRRCHRSRRTELWRRFPVPSDGCQHRFPRHWLSHYRQLRCVNCPVTEGLLLSLLFGVGG
jgi:hypothetical protein